MRSRFPMVARRGKGQARGRPSAGRNGSRHSTPAPNGRYLCEHTTFFLNFTLVLAEKSFEDEFLKIILGDRKFVASRFFFFFKDLSFLSDLFLSDHFFLS